MDPIQSLSAALPQQLTLKAVNRIHNHYSEPNDPNDTSYVDLVIEDGGILNGTFDGFCIDSDRAIDFGVDENFNGQIDANTNEVGGSYTAKVYSSYDPLPDELVGQGLIEKPENLDLLNWIINQDFTFQTSPSGGNYTWADIQRAIWTLIDDENSTAGGVGEEGQYWEQERVEEIVAAARANGEGFVPTYGQKVGVIIVPDIDGDGAPDAQIQFAAVDLAGLGDYVFYDSNANGVQDADEFGADGVVVKLLNADGSAVVDGNGNPITTTTDGNGAYSFTVPAGEYKVMFVAPEGFTFTNANVGGDDTLDSDADPFNGMTETIVIEAGDVFNGTLDAGLVRSAGLGNFVFEDTNADGVQDANEQGIAGVEVKLLADTDNDGQVDDIVKTTTTDADGFYEFTGLTQGDYRVMFTQPDGFDSVSPFQAGFDNSLDSDANPDNNLVSNVVTLAPGDFDERLDAGFYQRTPGLGDFVFFDNNANGIQDADEDGVEGVVVKLLNPDGSAAVDSDGNPITTTTDNQGGYAFFNLTPGEYKVMFVAPEGFVFTTANTGSDDALDSDANRNGITQTVFIQDGDFNDTLDAGIVRPAGLGNFVFEDANADGIQDANEQGIAGVEVKLLADIDNDGQVDDVLETTTTDENGFYEFTGLTQGDYRVMFTQPEGFDGVSPFQAGFDSSLDSDAGVGLMSNVVTLAPGDFDERLDAGFFKTATASLGDRVWYDTDGDGIQDAGEQGIEGVKVTLTGGGADGVIGNADDTTAETTTDANGNYVFEGLNSGEEYKVTFSHLPQGYEFTKANATQITGEEVIFESSFESAAKKTGFVSGSLEGWQSTDGYIEIHSTANSADGHNHIELNDDAIDYYNDARNIYRDIATEAGKQYTLTFQYAPRPGFSADVTSMEVRLDGATLLALEEDGSGSHNYNWKNYTVTFEGDGSTKQLEFLSTGTALAYGRGARLDDIKLVASMGSNDDTLDSDADPISGMTQIVTLADGEHNATLDAGIIAKPVKTGQIIGHDCIHEGDTASYKVKLDGIVTQDTYVTINIDNGTAKQADGYHVETVKSLSNPYTHNLSWGEKGQLYTANTYDRYYAARYWNGTHWFSGDLNKLSVGAHNLTDDFEVEGAQGDKLVVKIAAGSDTSESFDISALKEIQLGKMFSKQTSTEGTEDFSLNIEKIGEHEVYTGVKQIHIKDNYANYSPISFDLNGDGVQTISIEQGVKFDMLNTGTAVNTGWLSGEDGFLAVDNNGDGLISSRAELFGGLVGDGFAKLASFDSNGDGLVNESDDMFAELRLWQDSNENGITDQGELVSLTTAGITDLVTSYTDVFSTDAAGNVHGEHSTAKRNGSTIDMVDVYFQVAV